MSEYVRKDVIYRVPIQNGEMYISPSHDFLHRFERISAWILKYVATDAENNQKVCNVPLTDFQASWLVENCGLEVVNRTFIGAEEHEHWLASQDSASSLEEQFGKEFGE